MRFFSDSYRKGTGVSIPGDNAAGRDFAHLPPSRAEVKNGRSYTSTPSMCLHGVDRDKFTIYLYLSCISDTTEIKVDIATEAAV